MILLKAFILGIVEGVTEFLPISSTGHLIIVTQWVAYPQAQAAAFDIFIQFGAILAVVYHFRTHLLEVVRRAGHDRVALALICKVFLAVLPAALLGLLLHAHIEHLLFAPRPVAMALLAGGVAILVIERGNHSVGLAGIEAVGWRHAWFVGIAQTLSLIPGVSRAAATIMGGLLSGLDRPTATQFSFYLSIPTMFAASGYALFTHLDQLSVSDALPLSVGFATAFLSALVVVRALISYVQRHDFIVFGWYRIVAGSIILLALY